MVNQQTNIESSSESTPAAPSTPNVVYQPPKLSEIVEIVNLMGNVGTKVREDNAGDWTGAGSGTTGDQSGSGDDTSQRDQLIAKAPPVPVMQKQLIQHLEREMKIIRRQTKAVSRSRAKGSAYILNELYKKLRRLSELASQIMTASADVVKRFYISVFIDKQPMVVRGGSLSPSEE